jgi:hypothetical protein
MTLRVDPEDLRAAGNEIGTAAALLAGSLQTRVAVLSVAGQTSWSAVPVLETAAEVWADYLGGLHESVTESANGLLSAADLYVASDWGSAQRIRGSGGFFD